MPQIKRNQPKPIRYYMGDRETQARLLRESLAHLKIFNKEMGEKLIEEAIRKMNKRVDKFYGLDNKYDGKGNLRVQPTVETPQEAVQASQEEVQEIVDAAAEATKDYTGEEE